MADKTPVPVYLPRDLYQWLQARKDAGHGSLSQQIVGYCYQGRVRDELADALAEMQPDMAAALDRIRARIQDQGEKQ